MSFIFELIKKILGFETNKDKKKEKKRKKAIKKIRAERKSKFGLGMLFFSFIFLVGAGVCAFVPLANLTVGAVRLLESWLEYVIFLFNDEEDNNLVFLVRDLGDLLAAFTKPIVLLVMYAGSRTLRFNRSTSVRLIPRYDANLPFNREVDVKEYSYATDEEWQEAVAIDMIIWLALWYISWRVLRIINIIHPESFSGVTYEFKAKAYLALIKDQLSSNMVIGILTFMLVLWLASGWHIKIGSLVRSKSKYFSITPFDYDNIESGVNGEKNSAVDSSEKGSAKAITSGDEESDID